MQQFEKWIQGISTDDAVAKAAQHSLRVRLAAVQHYLPLAAEQPGADVEYVHELRVYTRRSMAALKLYADLLPKKETKWLRKTLRRIRSAAGDARDLDVLVQSHETNTGRGASEFLADIRQRREAAQGAIVAIHRSLKGERFRRHIDTMLGKAGERTSHSAVGSFGQWARRRLRKIVKRLFKASPTNVDDLTGLHRFRIRAKELRYAMELLAPGFPAAFREQLYPIVERLQEQLGEIHDHGVARARFHNWITETKSEREATHVRKLLTQEREKLYRLLRDFASWWTPKFEAELRNSFQRLIDRPATQLTA